MERAREKVHHRPRASSRSRKVEVTRRRESPNQNVQREYRHGQITTGHQRGGRRIRSASRSPDAGDYYYEHEKRRQQSVEEQCQRDRSRFRSPDEHTCRHRKGESGQQRVARPPSPTERRLQEESSPPQIPSSSVGPSSTENVRISYLEHVVELLLQERSSTQNRERENQFIVRPDCIPLFNPADNNSSVSRWIEKIDQLAQINSWNEETTIYHMQNRLDGPAKTWYYNLPNYNFPWDEWKALLTKTFPDQEDYAITLRKLVNRSKLVNETWTHYYFGKMELLQACGITGSNAVSCLIDGITDTTIQIRARAGRYSTPEDLYQEYLCTLMNQQLAQSSNYKVSGKRPIERRLSPVIKKITKDDSKVRRNMKCFNCGDSSHLASQCPKPRKECTNCNRLGHEKNNCSRKVKQEPKKVLQCETSRNYQDCYIVNCKVNDQILQGYIDTGCSIVAIKESSAKRLHLELTPCKTIITGYAGGVTSALYEATIHLEVDLMEAVVPALVVADYLQPFEVMIGQPFINKANVALVLQNNQLRLFDSTLVQLPQVDQLPPNKLSLRCKEDIAIPLNHVAQVLAYCKEEYHGDIFVDFGKCNKLNGGYIIPNCVTPSVCRVIPILNQADEHHNLRTSQRIARGSVCEMEVEQSTQSTPEL